MTTSESKNYKGYNIEREAFLKVGNYKDSIFEAINEAKDYISRNECRLLSIDISGLNMIDAMKVCVLASTFHYAKYCGGCIKWFVRDENIKNQIEMLRLDNTEVDVKRARKSYVDNDVDFVRKLTLCK